MPASSSPVAPQAATERPDGEPRASNRTGTTVSVIVPAHNRAGLVGETLDSVWAQTHRPVELVVVDDGSSDRTPGVVRDWLAAHPDDPAAGWSGRQIEQMNAGAPAARNRGLRESAGAWVQFLDSDDLIHPEKFARQLAAADPAGGLVRSDTGFFAGTRPGAADWSAAAAFGGASDEPLADHLRDRLLHTASALYRRDLCDAAGPWDESIGRNQDWEWNVRVLLAAADAGRPVVHVPGVLSLYRQHGDDGGHGATQIVAGYARPAGVRERLRVADLVRDRLERTGRLGPAERAALAWRYWALGLDALRCGAGQEARSAAGRFKALGGGSAKAAAAAVLSRLPAGGTLTGTLMTLARRRVGRR